MHGESCWHSLQHAQWEALLDPELPKQDLSPLKSPITRLSHTHFPPLPQINPCCAKQPRCKFLDGLLRLDPSSLNLLTPPPQKKARRSDRNATPEVVTAFTERTGVNMAHQRVAVTKTTKRIRLSMAPPYSPPRSWCQNCRDMAAH
jgi:hypothetical protein